MVTCVDIASVTTLWLPLSQVGEEGRKEGEEEREKVGKKEGRKGEERRKGGGRKDGGEEGR